MYAVAACRLKVVPVMPGAAAKAGTVSSMAATTTARSRVFKIEFFMLVALMAALLLTHTVRDAVADMNFGHQSAEVLRVVRKVIEIWGVEVIDLTGCVSSPVGPGNAGIKNHIEGLTAAQGDRVRQVRQ